MSRCTVLFVDDEEKILSALERALRREEYAVRTATDPEVALRHLAEGPVAVVVSDQRMPGMSGTELLAQVRRLSPDTVRLLLTGHADLPTAMAAINGGQVHRFITKPWDDEALKRTVREALAHYALVDENRHLHALTRAQNEELRSLNAALEERVTVRTRHLERKTQEVIPGRSFLVLPSSGGARLPGSSVRLPPQGAGWRPPEVRAQRTRSHRR